MTGRDHGQPDAATVTTVPGTVVADPVTNPEVEPPKKKRRTKAEIANDAAAVADGTSDPVPAGTVTPVKNEQDPPDAVEGTLNLQSLLDEARKAMPGSGAA